MRRKLVSCPWAALAFVSLLCDSSALSMAICVHQMHQLRPVSTAVRNCCKLGLKPAFSSFSDAGRAELPRRKGLRRGRASALHSDAQERMPSPASHLQPSPLLLTAMDRALPFGRCIGVALPSALTTDTLRAAEEELMPEEVSYCLALPPTLQVGCRLPGIGLGLGLGWPSQEKRMHCCLLFYEREQCTRGKGEMHCCARK